MRFLILSLPLLALCLLVSSSLFTTANAADPAMPPPIQQLVKDGAVARYLGADNGLNGWVTFKDGQEQYFYATPDGTGVVMGVLFNTRGDVITMRQIQQLRDKEGATLDKLIAKKPDQTQQTAQTAQQSPAQTPASITAQNAAANAAQKPTPTQTPPQSASKSDQFYYTIENSNWFALGDKNAPVVYSFIDPECPHCKDMIKAFETMGAFKNNQIQLRLIPVGILSEQSLTKAAYLLAAPNAAGDLLKSIHGDAKAIPVDPNLPTLGVQKNLTIMQAYKIDVTPFTTYRDKTGKVKILRGVPKDIKSFLGELK